MCGRYVYTAEDDLQAHYDAVFDNDQAREQAQHPNFNVAPSQLMPVVWHRESGRVIGLKRWGLIPFWAKDPKIGYKMINARAETVNSKPAFREAFKRHRCLVPANGYYEWQQIDKKTKQPMFIHRKDNQPISLAGLFDTWRDEDGKEIESYTIITTTPSHSLATIHDRMPVVLTQKEEEEWLQTNADSESLLAILHPYKKESELEAFPVSDIVNLPRNNSPKLIERI